MPCIRHSPRHSMIGFEGFDRGAVVRFWREHSVRLPDSL